MKVVCGTDFSAAAAKAADVALALATRCDGTLQLVHVLDLSRYERPSTELTTYLSDARQSKLLRETRRLRERALSVHEHLLKGRPADELTRFASRTGANLIIVSSRGHTAPVWWPVGSVAERVAFHSTVPTMVVRDEHAIRAWASGKRALRVFVGYEFSAASGTALSWVRSLEQIGPCQVTVAALAWPPQKSWRLGIGDDLSAASASTTLPAALRRAFEEKCNKLLGSRARCQVKAACGRPASQLLELARAAKADLVVVSAGAEGSSEQAWLGSVSRGMFYYAPFNVVCVPEDCED